MVKGIEPIDRYLEQIEADTYDGLTARGVSEADFNEIRSYLIDYSSGFKPLHSFVDSNSSIFDCIPIEQQWSLRNSSAKLITPPVNQLHHNHGTHSGACGQLSPYAFDQLGNRMFAQEGTIPVRRVPLWSMLAAGSVRGFQQKSHYGETLPPPNDRLTRSVVTNTHRWAHAAQSVNNIGMRSELTVWKPGVSPPSIFSLSQIWLATYLASGAQT